MGKKIKDMIKDEVEDYLKEPDSNIENDDEYEPPRFIGSSTKAVEEDRIIDELLASVPKNQGYYLKLYKEIRPNDFELKLRVDNFENWSDLEWEITNIIRAYTEKNLNRWGSGHYRVIIWREGGVRGPKFKPLDFFVDAQEALTNNNGNGNGQSATLSQDDINNKIREQFTSFGELVKTMKEMNPSQSTTDIQASIFDAFKTGLNIKEQTANNETQKEIAKENNNTQVMIELIRQQAAKPQDNLTAVLPELIKTLRGNDEPRQDKSMELLLALLPKLMERREEPKQDPLDTLIKLKQAGLIPDAQQNPSDQLSKTIEMLSSIVPLVQNFSGGGEKPSMFLEVLKILGPQVGKVVGDLTGTVKQVIAAKSGGAPPNKQNPVPNTQEVVQQNPINPPLTSQVQQSKLEGDNPADPYRSDNGLGKHNYDGLAMQVPDPNNTITNNQQNEELMFGLIGKIKKALQQQDKAFYPELQEMILSNIEPEVYDKLINKEISIDYIIENGKGYISELTLPATRPYLEDFVVWAKQREVIKKCPTCQEETTFISQEEYEENNLCSTCNGTL